MCQVLVMQQKKNTEIMSELDFWYDVVPLHRRKDLIRKCCKLLNSEWPRSDTARLQSLRVSCDEFPTCLILLDREENVLGHCKISLIPRLKQSCFIESVVIDFHNRSQGLGSRLLRGAEEYVAHKGVKNIYLITKGQEVFYLKNGYVICDPIKMHGIEELITPTTPVIKGRVREKNIVPLSQFENSAPPPPPMPNFEMPKVVDIRMLSHKTHMVKTLY